MNHRLFRLGWLLLPAAMWLSSSAVGAETLQIAVFQSDVTPPLGSPLCEGAVPPAARIVDRLTARGIVLVGAGKPIVLCAVDWVGIANASHDHWREQLATAARTDRDRVCVHALHQHDAPGEDRSTEELLASRGLRGQTADLAFAQRALDGVAAAVTRSLDGLRPVTHVGIGSAVVEGVASNRRLLGRDGRVQFVRYSSCADAAVRALPEGVIDPLVRLVSFWHDEQPLAVLSYYATHPQSYYGEGGVSIDFVGLARDARAAALPSVAHIHFNGAGGNVAAGKYNDGTPPRRAELAGHLADGMRRAWESTARRPITAADVQWHTVDAVLPLRDLVSDSLALAAQLDDVNLPTAQRVRAANDLAFHQRVAARTPVVLARLQLGDDLDIVHMPGELFVEYQLYAARLRPKATVCMAAYGDYGAGYIGTEIAYAQGGYETGPPSRTGPEVEALLQGALELLLR
ncbi:MAG: hypothetical protein K1X74_21090 [Pirellulales bacterium]|nr:hypothetical protein [Pirellulales bacterium]